MKKLHVIVHENCVLNPRVVTGESLSVLSEIKRIKAKENFITLDGNPEELAPNMPENNDELIVFVSGAFYGGSDWCVDKQVNALMERGYATIINHPACLRWDYIGNFPRDFPRNQVAIEMEYDFLTGEYSFPKQQTYQLLNLLNYKIK